MGTICRIRAEVPKCTRWKSDLKIWQKIKNAHKIIYMKSILIISVLLFSTITYGTEKVFFKLPYVVEPNDTLESIYKIFVYDDRNIVPDHPAYLRTAGANPDITDWNKLEPGKVFDLFIKIEDMDKAKYKAYVEYIKTNPTKMSKRPDGWKANIFYMASYGRFTQTDSSVAYIEFNQNSPVTIGSGVSYYPMDSKWSVAGSAYVSHLLASGSNLDNRNVTIPPEIGANLYGEYKFMERNFTGYFGFDYEQFSTFNMGAIQQNQKLLVDRNTVLFATVGGSSALELFGSPFFTKLSFSRSLATTTDAHSGGTNTSGGYEGYKVMWYVNKKISPDMFIHSLIKYHWMEGPSDLKTLRIGLGFGFIFL